MEREKLEDVGVERKIILKRILRKQWEEGEGTHLSQAGDQRRTVVNMVTDIPVQ
jgi:hypothetical protein